MNLKEWRNQQRMEIELPSGLTVTLRRISLVDLASRGKIPTPLVARVNEVIGGKPFSVATVEDFVNYGEVIDMVVRACVESPPLAPEDGQADDEHLALAEMALDDRVMIFNTMHKPSEALGPFVANRREMWTLHLLAKEYGARPSDVLGVRDEWAAYQLDVACLYVSKQVGELGAAFFDDAPATGGKSVAQGKSKEASKFADPRGMFAVRKMTIPASGVW